MPTATLPRSIAIVALLAAACGAATPLAAPGPQPLAESAAPPLPASATSRAVTATATHRAATLSAATPAGAPTNIRLTDTNEYSFPQLIPFDGILPVYEPRFVGAADAPLLDDELVMGIALNGEAKAYPVTVLRFREMVDDELAGIPILVTW